MQKLSCSPGKQPAGHKRHRPQANFIGPFVTGTLMLPRRFRHRTGSAARPAGRAGGAATAFPRWGHAGHGSRWPTSARFRQGCALWCCGLRRARSSVSLLATERQNFGVVASTSSRPAIAPVKLAIRAGQLRRFGIRQAAWSTRLSAASAPGLGVPPLGSLSTINGAGTGIAVVSAVTDPPTDSWGGISSA